ncbi:MAG: aldehyde dehydrogenase family protein [Acidimicrobiales bacterium]
MSAPAFPPTSTRAAPMLEARCLVGAGWVDGDIHTPVLDKYRGNVLGSVAVANAALVRAAVAAAASASQSADAAVIGPALQRASELVLERREELAARMVDETGFTQKDAAVETARCAHTLTLCAEEARRLRGETVAVPTGVPERVAFTIRVPVGVVAAITPFNSPLNTVAHKIGPALAAGNGVILKPSSIAPFASTLLVQYLVEAGVPAGLLNLVHGAGDDIGETLVADPRVSFIAFTGSTAAGRRIQALSGLRRTQMELGAISCTVVCEDADLDWAVPRVVRSAFRKAGQVCTSIQRLYVQRAVFDSMLDRIVAEVDRLQVGDPRDPETDVGPMISLAEASRAVSWVNDAVAHGARCVRGGRRDGPLMSPTVLLDARLEDAVMSQEAFAPVLNVVPFDGDAGVVDEVNALPFGLASGVFTRDLSRALAFARRLQMGSVYVNDTSSSRIDAAPYGGVKDSGFGQEGPSRAILEMTDERLVVLTVAGPAAVPAQSDGIEAARENA